MSLTLRTTHRRAALPSVAATAAAWPLLRQRNFHSRPPSPVEGAYDPHNALVCLAPPKPSSSSSVVQGPLQGWTVSVKDNICTSDMPTSCASAMLQDYTSSFEATAVLKLRQAGALIIGKTNCDEFGMGSANVHSHHGPVLNPAHPADTSLGNGTVGRQRHRKHYEPRVAGGSSGGAAASVKAGLCRIAIASDTGGSIRLPAACCGVWGLKPSYGVVSRWGLVSYADSLDTLGVLARSVDDLRTSFNAIASYDPRDPSAIPPETRNDAAQSVERTLSVLPKDSSQPLAGLRVGIPREFFPAELEPRVIPPLQKALRRLREQGASLHSVSLPSTPYALSAYYVLASAEASSNLARYDGIRFGHRSTELDGIAIGAVHSYAATRSEGFGDEVKRRILLGTYALTASAFDNFFLQAQRVRLMIQEDFDRVLRIPSALRASSARDADGVDVLITPTAVSTAPTLAAATGQGGLHDSKAQSTSTSAYVQDVLGVPASLAGLPAMSVPAGVADDGWPVGVSVTTQWGCEKLLWRVGNALEGLDEA